MFEYVGIVVYSTFKVRYRYMLEGFDLDWIYSRDRQVPFIPTCLPAPIPLNWYATENETFDDEPVQTYSFTVKAPYWKQWWFVLLSILLVAGVSPGLYACGINGWNGKLR
ncbi:MAG: hypothetical protein H6557_28825 [Lewinellaceae bacterium]|nr:hypothetical protein [Lewinellaceae bacterium]